MKIFDKIGMLFHKMVCGNQDEMMKEHMEQAAIVKAIDLKRKRTYDELEREAESIKKSNDI